MTDELGAKRRITLKDIALQTGYTVNTISRALKDKPDIAPETRAYIQQVADQAGYVRNTMASALRSGRSHTLALIVGNMANPKFAIMANDIETAAREMGFAVMMLCTHGNEAMERQAIQVATEQQVDGIILNPCQQSSACLDQLAHAQRPFVLIERHFSHHPTDSVVCDEVEGGRLAAAHLLAQGCRRLVHFHGDLQISGARARLAGFRAGAAPLPEEDVLALPMKGGEADARQLINLYQQGVDGAFMFSDMAAWDISWHLARQAPQVLEALRFVGFDNIQGRLPFAMPLCTIDSSSTALCRTTVELLHRRINGWVAPPQQLVLPVHLVCRGAEHPA